MSFKSRFKKGGGWRKVFDPLGLTASPEDTGPSEAETLLMKITQQMFEQSQPLRKGMLGQFEDVIAGRFDPTTSPMYAHAFSQGKQGIEGQYDLAKENILSNLPRGGAQVQGLIDTELGRAEQASSLPAMMSQGIINDMMNKAYGSVFSGPAQTGGLTDLANLGLQKEMMAAQQQQGKASGLGGLIGSILSMFGGS